MRTALFLSILPLAICNPLFSQATTPAPTTFTGAPFSESAADLLAASAAVPADHDYDEQVLLQEGTYRIAADATLSYQWRLVYRIDSQEGLQNWSEISANWDPWCEKPAQLNARVLRADGSFAQLDQATITDAPVNAEDSETFSSEHVRRAPLPGVAVGSIVEEVVTMDEKIPYFAGGSLYRFGFQQGVPTARERMIVDLPSSTPFKDVIRGLPSLTVTRTNENGTRHIVYEATNLPAAHESDIELSTNEPVAPIVEFATGASWVAVASAYATLADPQANTADAKTILPDDLPTGRQARIQAVVQRLHQDVRYTGVEFGAARLTPESPSEVIKRHYGDCKDKANLLVAMLRAAGIPANLALLSVGPGRDVDPTLPGMNRFDHAIVYVPAGKSASEPAIWIDATAQFNEVGTLPFEDQGRSALIIAPETVGLTKIPGPSPKDSVLIETRTFTLSELGPAHVVEDSATHGYVDANYRSSYGNADTTRTHDELENYVHNAYLAKTLTTVTHGDGTDLLHPFHLTLVADGARRGDTAIGEAVVALFPNATAIQLPKWFGTPPPVIGPDTSPTTKRQLELAQQSRAATYTIRPFISEQRARIVIPAGFVLRSLPADRTTQLGPATLTETYSAKDPGLVTATFRFDSGPSTLTVDQALALRDAVLELNKRDYVAVYFDQVGAKALTAGHIREALESDHALIQASPSDALHHTRLARALLEAGIGDEAHAEALRATQLDPKSSPAFATLGWTLEFNSLGERFGKGYDLAGAIAAYRQAIVLDPDHNDPRYDLAILYEFDARGVRYTSDADLPDAIKQYRELIERTKDRNPQAADQYRENLLYCLLFSRQYADLDKMLAEMPFSNPHTVFAIVSATAQHGVAAGLAAADHGNAAAADRNKNLLTAGSQLAMLHLYTEAADVMSAGIQGGDDAPTAARQIEMYRGIHPASLAPLPATNPAAPVQALNFGMMSGNITRDQIAANLSHQAYASTADFDRDINRNLASAGFLRTIAAKSDLTLPVLYDLIAGNMTFASTGDDATGYAVTAQSPGAQPSHYYVVREDGAYRIVADVHDQSEIGNAVLYALQHNNPGEAKALLDWKRDLVHRGSGDDPFEVPLLPRFWTVGSTKPDADSPAAMRLAAISMLAGSMDAKPYLAEVVAAQAKASGARQTDLDILLASAAVGAEQPDIALPAALRLLDQEPDSLTALRLAGQSYAFKNDPKSWQALLAPKLEKRPKDHDLLEEQSHAQTFTHDFATAQTTEQKVLDSGKATAEDYNEFAWLGLFHNYLGDDVTKAAQQSNMLTNNGNFASLHTLACVYAAQGRTTEARQVLKQAMDAANQVEPDSSVWYALGLIYEQYGAKKAALDAYNKVQSHEFDNHTYIDPVSTYILAQQRIKSITSSN